MNKSTRTLALAPKTDLLLRDLIHGYCGQCFEDARLGDLIDKLTPLAHREGCESFMDLYYLLKYSDGSRNLWRDVLDALAVNETYFWREFDQLRAMRDTLIERLAHSRGAKPIRIWSAACASGEEPLSIVIALEQAGWFERVQIEIHASDASCAALSRARAGIYRDRSFRALPDELKFKYFDPHPQGWRIAPSLHQRVHWHHVNLLDRDAVAGLARADIVFCRNVFIYFSQSAIRSTVAQFAQCMPAPGYLCVAAAESLLRVTREFELTEIDGALIYAKRGGSIGQASAPERLVA